MNTHHDESAEEGGGDGIWGAVFGNGDAFVKLGPPDRLQNSKLLQLWIRLLREREHARTGTCIIVKAQCIAHVNVRKRVLRSRSLATQKSSHP